jgi:tRNA 2-selenouridine synthase
MTKSQHNLHSQNYIQISIPDMLDQPCQIVDVRSPDEYSEGSISNSINIPLLSNEERNLVGILYKKFGQKKAIEEGYQILDPKLDVLKKWFDEIVSKERIVIYCARGGMRSKVVTTLLKSWGYDAIQLLGGYKAYRNHVITAIDNFRVKHLFVLHGQTGVGKTLIINKLDNAIDLEGIAQHRGSLFGAIGKTPRTQKQFESELFNRLLELDNSKAVFVEGESRKIGKVSIPNAFFKQLLTGSVVLLEATVGTRVTRIIDEYIHNQANSAPEIKTIIGKLKAELGKNVVDDLQQKIDNCEYSVCFQYLLEQYYDKKYIHTINQLNVMHTIDAEDLDQATFKINHL